MAPTMFVLCWDALASDLETRLRLSIRIHQSSNTDFVKIRWNRFAVTAMRTGSLDVFRGLHSPSPWIPRNSDCLLVIRRLAYLAYVKDVMNAARVSGLGEWRTKTRRELRANGAWRMLIERHQQTAISINGGPYVDQSEEKKTCPLEAPSDHQRCVVASAESAE